jgi:tRNA pseudouridine38-40 synthase
VLERRIELSTEVAVGPGPVALVIEYDGTGFHGWQDQKSSIRTVGGTLEAAVASVADHAVDLVCAGRTDAGVHACYQVVHFEARVTRPLRSWVLGINSALPSDIRVHWAGSVPDGFSARFAATARRYRYLMLSRETPPALLRQRVAWTHYALDPEAMDAAAQYLLGEWDFSAFRAAGCQANTPNREITGISVTTSAPFVILDVTANAFLHHMVRNIAGTLMAVGRGAYPAEWVAEVLASRDRRRAGITAPPEGLYLVDIDYPPEIGIPRPLPGPLWAVSGA